MSLLILIGLQLQTPTAQAQNASTNFAFSPHNCSSSGNVRVSNSEGVVCSSPVIQSFHSATGFTPNSFSYYQYTNTIFNIAKDVPEGNRFKANAGVPTTLTINLSLADNAFTNNPKYEIANGLISFYIGTARNKDQPTSSFYDASYSLEQFGSNNNFCTNYELNASITFERGATLGYVFMSIPVRDKADGVIRYEEFVIPFVVEGPTVASDEPVPVLGTVVEPQIPYMVLHAPPGSNSSTEFSTSSTTCRSTSTSYASESSNTGNVAVKLGTSGTIGFVVQIPYEFSVTFSSSVSSGGAEISTTDEETCITIDEGFATNAMTDVEGGGDLFIGYGLSYSYGVYEYIEIDPDNCRPVLEKGLIYWPIENSETQFAYTTERIKQEITDQQAIADNTNNSVKVRNIAQNQIDVWQQVLNKNLSTINDPNNAILSNRSFGGDTGPQTYASTIQLSQTNTIEYQQYLEATAGIETVIEIGGSGVSGGFEYDNKKTMGNTQSGTNQNAQVLAYTLDDGDSDDDFNVQIRRDPIYGTPIFKLQPGTKTSCPYQGGEQLDQPRLSNGEPFCTDPSGNINIKNAPIGQAITVPLDICNDSSEPRTYRVKVKGGTNTKNAILILNGGNISNENDSKEFENIPAGGCFTNVGNKPELLIQQNAANDLIYSNIVLQIYPECEPDLVDEITVTVEFGNGTLNRCFVDGDVDGIEDANDNCPNVANAAQTDADGDGIGDECDSCPTLANANPQDLDEDGLFDLCDNCPDAVNEDQLDFDGDGVGDECDSCPELFGDPDMDSDGDGLLCDNCPNSPNSGLVFDGVDDYLTIPNKDSLAPTTINAITFEAWVYPTINSSNYGAIASMYDNGNSSTSNFFIERLSDGRISLAGNGAERLHSVSVVPVNTWTHIAIVLDDDECAYDTKIYINGMLDQKGDLSYNANNGGEDFHIGYLRRNGVDRYFEGRMDDIRIWKGARSRAEISDNRLVELNGNETDLLAYYSLDDGAPGSSTTVNLIDQSGNGNNIIIAAQDGLAFDGVDDELDIPNHPATNFAANQNFTIEMWVKIPSTPQPNSSAIDVSLLEKWTDSGGTGYPYAIRYILNSKTIRVLRYDVSNDPNIFSTTTFDDDQWHHIAFVKDGGTLRLYVDGQQEGTTNDTVTGSSTFNTSPIRVGHRRNRLHTQTGMKELRFWNIVRTPAQINSAMSQTLSGTESGLVGYYPLDETITGSPTTIEDQSPTANDGLAYNFATTGTTVGSLNWSFGAPINEFDTDNDGVGDNCDLCNGDDRTGDSDGDGICDDLDPDILPCDDVNITVQNTTHSDNDTQRAEQSITTSGMVIIPENMTVSYYAGNTITLLPGFTASGTFTAKIEDCVTIMEGSVEQRTTTALPSENAINVFPNPTSIEATIQYELAEAGAVRIVAYDMQGRAVQVLQETNEQAAGKHQLTWQTAQLSNGMYFIQLQTPKGVKLEKLMITHL